MPSSQPMTLIDINQYTPSGEGGTAITYKHKTLNTLAKLYNAGFEAEAALREFKVAEAVFDLGIPTPKPIRMVSDGNRVGAEYEYIPAKRSFARILGEEPGREDEIASAFAQAARTLHGTKADADGIPSIKDTLRDFYLRENCVDEEYAKRALAFLDKAKDGDTCIHGDLHIGNIITDGKRTLWIDIGQFSRGVPHWDIGWFWTMCHNLGEARADFLLHMTPSALTSFWDKFLPLYLGTNERKALEDYTQDIMPYYAAKVPYMVHLTTNGPFPEAGCKSLIRFLQ